MIKYFSWVLLLLTATLFFSCQKQQQNNRAEGAKEKARFIAGQDYRVLPESALQVDELQLLLEPTTPNQVEVVWFFWYGCPSCSQALPELDRLSLQLGDRIALRMVPLAVHSWRPEALDYYVFKQLGVAEKVRNDFYQAVQGTLGRGAAPEAVAQWLEGAFAVPASSSMPLFNSALTQEYVQQSLRLTQAFGIDRVPVMVIARRYLLPYQAETLVPMAEELVAQELRSR